MAVGYFHLQYEDYKELEKQMRAFAETVHKSMSETDTGFYHKSIRLRISPDFMLEFHGPLVRGEEKA